MPQPHISSTDRIRDLSAINSEVPTLLSSASGAIRALTGETSSNPDTMDSDASLQNSKEAFTSNAQAYFTTIQSIMARLRRQTYALEEAGIIAAEAPIMAASTAQEKRTAQPGQRQGPQGGEEERLVNGGLGNLDVAWLNSRVGKGGLEKEGEVLEEAKRLAEEALRRKGADDEMRDG
ncbi:hypothetical protein B9Z65_7893 [Elsinoe australis]|uniref:Mediator of RNA polymerase II transcription subunit 11 n=1 Tax=Elsinoe australis TaxID=40998 RepID=A0A2P8A0U4_9PEZI|nr:hypothetical protein B9Z65_7893 [Elsinoe australis]